mmetsp:Transcript_11295/g.22311  ORF Transcript_11295/g.22311 Transcript_11295/m.22311 type:complete len:91 (+) Transcript_11295:151-423(+)
MSTARDGVHKQYLSADPHQQEPSGCGPRAPWNTDGGRGSEFRRWYSERLDNTQAVAKSIHKSLSFPTTTDDIFLEKNVTSALEENFGRRC